MAPTLPRLILLTSLLVLPIGVCRAEEDALALFKRRITPLLRSPNPSSCAECHLSGVDLRNYIGETQEQTFAALRDAGLVDVKQPDNSKLLAFIQRKPEKPTPVSEAVRKQEYDAFRAWIHAAIKDPRVVAAQTDSDQLGPAAPLTVVRHSRLDRVVESFVENIWSEMGRCASCHSPELNRGKIGRNGHTKEDVDAISWLVPRDPAATLRQLVEAGNIDTDAPEESPVLTKPAGLAEHGGGPKFAVGSRTDKNFRRFLVDYAAVVNGKYVRADQLPTPPKLRGVMTKQHLRIVDVPEQFHRKLLRVDLYRWIEADGDNTGRWSESPWGTAENPIAGKRQLWQSMVTAVAPRGSRRAAELKPEQPLPGGRYLAKIYIDQQDRTKANRDYELGETELYGEVEFDGPWAEGYQPPKIIHAPQPK